jgi:hypothetical protein
MKREFQNNKVRVEKTACHEFRERVLDMREEIYREVYVYTNEREGTERR